MWDKHVCMNEREQGEDVRSPLFIPFVKRNTDRADDSSNQPSLRYFIWSMSKLVFSLSWIFFFKAGKLFVNMHLLRRSTDSCCQISARFFLITKEQHKCPSLLVVVTEKIKHNVQEVFFFFLKLRSCPCCCFDSHYLNCLIWDHQRCVGGPEKEKVQIQFSS